MADFNSGFDRSVSENAEATELQKMIAVEQQKAQFQAQVHNFTDVCWDKCVEKPGSKMDSRTETCLINCVERFIDTTLTITNRFTQMVHNFTDVCWDKCVEKPGSKMDSRTETCLINCVERFIDTTLTITNRFTQMVQKGAH